MLNEDNSQVILVKGEGINRNSGRPYSHQPSPPRLPSYLEMKPIYRPSVKHAPAAPIQEGEKMATG